MKYQHPVNTTPTVEVPEPAYFNGDANAGQKGAIPPGAAIEHPMREILAVISGAGLTPMEADLTQLRQAIQQMINTSISGGSPPATNFQYNPVYPEITVNGGVASISASTGEVVLAAGQQWVHRGGTLYNSSDLSLGARTKSTVASKTYHMRWRYNGGSPTLALYDLADVGYNPGAVAETNAQFDSTFDDLLLARVVTNGANVPVVTALFNRNRLVSSQEQNNASLTLSGQNGAEGSYAFTLNWARTPEVALYPKRGSFAGTPGGQNDYDFLISGPAVSRYAVTANISWDFATDIFAVMRAWA